MTKALYVAFAATTIFTQPAIAQDVTERADAAAPSMLDDIVVTAQKSARGESVQKIPLAVTAVNKQLMEDNQLTSITDVGRLAPNVSLAPASSFPAFANFYIRGIGLNGTVRSIDPAVSLVTDGMVNEYLLGTLLDTFDVQSVEILRGPQGVLQGRNATGGAISFTSRRPTNDLELEATARVGNGGRFDASFLAAGPLVEDKILAKIGVLRRKSDGLFHDRNNGVMVPSIVNPTGIDSSAKYDSGAEDTWAIRPTIVFKPIENLQISLIGEYLDQQGGAGVGARFVTNATNMQTIFGYTPTFKKWDMNTNREGVYSLKQKKLIGEITLDAGFGVFTSVTGYRDVSYKTNYDAAGFPFILFTFPEGNFDKSKQYSEELRFASDFSDTIRFVVGGYYSDLSMTNVEMRLLSGYFGGGNANLIRSQRGRFRQDGTSKALFYNVEIIPLRGLTLSHGGRYTKDKKTIDIVPLTLCTGSNFTACPDTATTVSASYDDFSPRFSAQYQITSGTQIYASWTKGYRSGNFNARANSLAAIGPADPETVKTIEGGLKSTFLDGRARINLAAYTSDYSDIQRTITIGPTQTLGNAGSASIKGVELETSLLPVRSLELTANVGYIDAKFDTFQGLDVDGNGYNPAVDPELARKLKFERVPKWTMYLAANYTHDIPGWDAKLTGRINYNYQTSVFFDVLNQIPQGSVGLLGGSITFKKGSWSLTAFGRNLTNKEYADQGSQFVIGPAAGPGSRLANHVWGGEPRTFGLELAFKM